MTVAELEKRLKAHDFYYAWSEDHGVFARGADEQRTLVRAMRGFPMREVARLVNTFIPRELRESWMQEIAE